MPVSWSIPTTWHLPHWPVTFEFIYKGKAREIERYLNSIHVRVFHQLTTKRVFPIINCDQLSSSNASPPAMTKLARKQLVIFLVSGCWSLTEASCLRKGDVVMKCNFVTNAKHVMKIYSLCQSLASFEWDAGCSDLLLINFWMSCTLAQLIIRYWASFTRDRDVVVAVKGEIFDLVYFGRCRCMYIGMCLHPHPQTHTQSHLHVLTSINVYIYVHRYRIPDFEITL